MIGDTYDTGDDSVGVIRLFQNNIGDAVTLSDDQIRSGRGTSNVTTTRRASLSLSGKGTEARATISIYVDENLLAEVRADANGEWAYTWLGTETGCGIEFGETYYITVTQTDLAGNISELSASYIINIGWDD